MPACFHTNWLRNVFWVTGRVRLCLSYLLVMLKLTAFSSSTFLVFIITIRTKAPPHPHPTHCAGLEVEMREEVGCFDWLRCWDAILSKLQSEVCACAPQKKNAVAMCAARFIALQAHLFIFYTSFRLRRASSRFRLCVWPSFTALCDSHSNNIT